MSAGAPSHRNPLWALHVHVVILLFLAFGAMTAWFGTHGWKLIATFAGILVATGLVSVLRRSDSQALSQWVEEVRKFRGQILFGGYAVTLGALVIGGGMRVWPHQVTSQFQWVTSRPGPSAPHSLKPCADSGSCVLVSGQSADLRFTNSHRNYSRVSVVFDVTSPDDASGGCTPTDLRAAYADDSAEPIDTVSSDREPLRVDLREDQEGQPITLLVKVDPTRKSLNCQYTVRVKHARLSLGKWFV